MNTMRKRNVWLLVLICSVVLVACGSGDKAARETAEKAIEKNLAAQGQKADVTISSDEKNIAMTVENEQGGQTSMEIREDGTSMVVTGDDGKVAMMSGLLAGVPEGFPKDVPVHSSLKINMALTEGDENGAGFTLQATTEEKFEDMVQYYTQEIRKQGWTEQMNMQQNMEQPMQMLVYQKDERTLNIVIQKDSDAVNVTLNVSQG